MKKIPTLFKRKFENHKVVKVLPEVTPGFEWVLEGEGIATVKIDGSCCAVINGELYRRFDAKPGRWVPPDAIPCSDPDPITGHWPHWVKCDRHRRDDCWFFTALSHALCFYTLITGREMLEDGTYEAIGIHFNGNPYNLNVDTLEQHGVREIQDLNRSFEGIKSWLETHDEEGIVFWKDGEPQCKIKRSDFGIEWPIKKGSNKDE